MFSVEHASSMGPAVMEEGRGGGGGGGGATGFLFSSQTSCGISTGTGWVIPYHFNKFFDMTVSD